MASKRNLRGRVPDPPKPRGPEPKYQAIFVKQAYQLAMLGHTNAEMAEVFDVRERTVGKWIQKFPAFRAALKKGREIADVRVVESLYHRALGYSHPAVKIMMRRDGKVVKVPFLERFAPDTTACIFWLKNRQPEKWRDRAPDRGPNDPTESAREIRDALKAMAKADGPEEATA